MMVVVEAVVVGWLCEGLGAMHGCGRTRGGGGMVYWDDDRDDGRSGDMDGDRLEDSKQGC
jgi:hypothetical protein